MKYSNKMINYRLATKEDNEELIKLTADAGMDGAIALRIDRNPNFFNLLELRGDTRVYVAEENEKIIGSLCVSLQYVYIGRKLYPVHYIGDFKVAKKHRNRGIGLNLTNTVANHLISIDADLVFLNVSKGNHKPFSFFKNRAVGTDFKTIGDFNIYQFVGKKMKNKSREYTVQPTIVSDEIIQLFEETYRNYELGTHITREKLKGTNIYTISHNGVLVAAMSLIDTMHLKQNIVTNVSWKMSSLLKLINKIGPLFGFSKMPVLHQPVSMIYIKYIAFRGNEKRLFNAFINYARNIVYKKSYSFVSIGVHEKDPINTYLSGKMKFTFNSVGMLSSLKRSTYLVKKINEGIPFEDYSIV